MEIDYELVSRFEKNKPFVENLQAKEFGIVPLSRDE